VAGLDHRRLLRLDRAFHLWLVRARSGTHHLPSAAGNAARSHFTIAFGPKLPKGTKLLVKFRSATGDRSYAVTATR